MSGHVGHIALIIFLRNSVDGSLKLLIAIFQDSLAPDPSKGLDNQFDSLQTVHNFSGGNRTTFWNADPRHCNAALGAGCERNPEATILQGTPNACSIPTNQFHQVQRRGSNAKAGVILTQLDWKLEPLWP